MTAAARRPLWFRIPVIGWIARDLLEGDDDHIWYLLATVLSLWGIAVLAWGLPALAIGALAAVPVCFALLLLVTRG